MADTPLATELEDSLALAQRIELFTSEDVSPDTADDKLTTMRDFDLEILPVETRINHGLTRVYGHGAPDIGIRFVLSLTKDIFDYLRPRGVRTSNGVIPTYKWAMKATSNDGTSKTITVDGKLTEKKYRKVDGDQGEPTDIECFIRVLDKDEPAAT